MTTTLQEQLQRQIAVLHFVQVCNELQIEDCEN